MATAAGKPSIEDILRDRLARGELDLPPLPEVAQRVLALSSDPKATSEDLARVVSRDQGLAAGILRAANSAALGGRVKVVSLSQAVNRLGMQQISDMAVSLALRSKDFHTERFDKELRSFWKHALASGAFAKQVARAARQDAEKAFLCGLLHHVGKPLVLLAIGSLATRVARRADTAQIEQAVERLHRPVGLAAAEAWELPKTLHEVIGFWDDYERAPTFKVPAMVTCAADRLATFALDPGRSAREAVEDHPVFTDLGLGDGATQELLARAEEVLAETNMLADGS